MADYDESGVDILGPKAVHEHIRSHDKYMRENRVHWSLAKAAYLTRYWEHVRGASTSSTSTMSQLTDIDVEVNRLWGVITSYLSALYPRAARSVLGPDALDQGDPMKAELAVNRWLAGRKIHQRIIAALRQGLLYPGTAMKVGYDPGHGDPLERVWARVIPWWEVMLDRDAGDSDDERYRGHIYFRPKQDVEREYDLEDLNGTGRIDFLSKQSKHDTQLNSKRLTPSSDNRAFVRVLEFCNLKDYVRDSDNPDIIYQGRLEIYVLGQGERSKKPVWIGPLPFATTAGEAMSHVIPLIFNHEPEFPLRGIPHSQRLIPQLRELNGYRSFMAMATRKDTRQYVTRKGTFNSDELTNLTEGHDGLVLEVEQGFERPLADAILPIMNAPISSNIDRYLSQVERDLEMAIGTSPAARGVVTKATAFEVQTVQQYTESEYGLHASIRDEWLAQVVRVLLRALISAMQDVGDSAGAYEGQAVEYSEVEAKQEQEELEGEPEDSEDEERDETLSQVKHSVADSVRGSAMPFLDDDAVDDYGKQELDEETIAIEQRSLRLRDRKEVVEVTVSDLDGEFEISFVEGGRTPLNEAAMQQNLVALLEPLGTLWQASQDKGPLGVFSRAYMKVIAERFDLPKDLHPEELDLRSEEAEERATEEAEEQAAQAPPQQPQQPQPPEAAPGPPMGPPPMGGGPGPDQMAQIASLPPEQAIPMLREMFAGDPQMQATLDQLEALPPEQQARLLASIAGGGPPVGPEM